MQRLSISRKQNLIICNETYFNKQQISILLSVISLCLISLVIYLSTHLYFQWKKNGWVWIHTDRISVWTREESQQPILPWKMRLRRGFFWYGRRCHPELCWLFQSKLEADWKSLEWCKHCDVTLSSYLIPLVTASAERSLELRLFVWFRNHSIPGNLWGLKYRNNKTIKA